MTLFWIIASGLIGLALLFILPPLFSTRGQDRGVDQDALNLALFRRQLEELDADLAAGELDRGEYKAARRDLERELLYDVDGPRTDNTRNVSGGRWAPILLGVAVPVVAVSLYLYLGEGSIIPRLQAAASDQKAAPHPGSGGEMPPLAVMVQRLADKLERNPENLEGWMMLGRSYFAMGQPERALHALEQAYGLAPENPDVLVTYAEAVAANNEGKLAGRPAELIQSALKTDPRHAGARWLQGLVSFQDARYVEAAEQWGALEATLDPRSKETADLRSYIAEARSRAGLGPQPAENAAQIPDSEQATLSAAGEAEKAKSQTPGPPPATTGTGVTVEVSLAQSLRSRVETDDSVFVYAKAVSGPPMPLAAHRARVADLPLTVTLDDSMAMIPAMKLSGFDKVTVGARISKSGQAIPASGDLEGEVSPAHPGDNERVKVVIDRVRP
jgi:cytochrome c-type biogenesis protein CcmH